MAKKRLPLNLILIFSCLIICLVVWQMSIVIPILFSPSSPQFKNVASYTLNKNGSHYIYPMKRLHPSDYFKLMNSWDFKFNMLSVCDSNLLLIITVFSAPTNFEQRISIRETWGRSRKGVKVVFIIGHFDNINVHKNLEEENKEYGDLIQGRFLDISMYKTNKYIAAFKYVIYHCPQAKYILKVNDDIFVNVYTMLHFLNKELSPYGAMNLLLCTPLEKTEKQNIRIKWIAPFPEYTDAYYPPYCQEWAALYSPDVIFTLYEDLQKMQHFWIEDLLTTGILAKNANIPCISTRALTLSRRAVDEIVKKKYWDSQNKRIFLYTESGISAEKMYLLWGVLKDPLKNNLLPKVRQ